VLEVIEGDFFDVTLDTQSDASVTVVANATWFAMEIIENHAGNAVPLDQGVSLPFKGALVKITADESIPNATETDVPWDAEVYDIGDWVDISGNPTRLTVPEGVTRVRVSAGIYWLTSATIGQFFITKNGSQFDGGGVRREGAGSDTLADNVQTAIVDVSAGDYFELAVTQTSGAPRSLRSSTGSTYFSIVAVEGLAPSTVPRGAFVRLTATEAVIVAGTTIPWDEIDYDTDSIWSSGDSTKLTVPAGVTRVKLTANARFDNTGNIHTADIRKNGAAWLDGPFARVEVGRGELNLVSAVVEVVEGDYFTLFLTTSVNTNIITSNSWFAMEIIEPAVVTGRPELYHIQHQEADGGNGGTTVSTTWNVRPLNTELTTEISGASLASNQITLPAGTYEITALGNTFEASHCRMRLRDTTGSATLALGMTLFSSVPDNVNVMSSCRGRFTLTVTSVLELQQWTGAGVTTFGFGIASDDTDEVEVFTDVMIHRIK
jgi:hypothetical protein